MDGTIVPILNLYAPDGHKLFAKPLTTSDGVPAVATAAAIDGDGTVAVTYRDLSKPRPRHGIALLDQTGRVARSVDTDPYLPGHICFAEDGSIWTAGIELPTNADFMTVRKYSRSGGETAAFLPLSELSSLHDASLHPVFHQMMGGWRMRAAKDRIGTVADLKPVSQWLELDLDGKLLGRWDDGVLGLNLGYMWSGAGFTSSGALYAQQTIPGRTPELLLLDKTTGKWNKTASTMNGVLLAADGEDLVFKMNTTSGNFVVWVRMRAQWPPPLQ